MKNIEQRVICWDLDETLGSFTRIAWHMQEIKPERWMSPVLIRRGLKPLLRTLTHEGFTHVVTTSGMQEYAEQALTRTGLRHYFLEVYGRESVSLDRWGKYYQCVADRMGFSEYDMRSRALVIGDAPGDQPMDIAGLVFLHLSPRVGVEVVKPLTETLLRNGEGSFLEGFERFYATLGERRYLELASGVQATLEYRSNSYTSGRGERVVPTIHNLLAEGYEHKLIRPHATIYKQ